MNFAADIVVGVFGAVAAAFAIWLFVKIVNDRRWIRVAYAAAVAAPCLWLPFSWLVWMPGGFDGHRLAWLKLWPILPGLVPAAYFFHPRDAPEFVAMGITTLMLASGLIWLGCRGWKGLLAAAVLGSLVSIPSALIAYALYCA